jgi:peptidase E
MPSVIIFLDRHPWLFSAIISVSLSVMMTAVLNGNWITLTAAAGALVFGWCAGGVVTYDTIARDEEICDIDDTYP